MSLPFFIARRYFLSRRKKNFINIISWLSMVGLCFSTAALIIVLSVFNGLEVLLRSLYTSFDPELKIEAVQGKTFEVTPAMLKSIQSIEGVKIVTEVIEDYAYVRYGDAAMAVTLKGVSENFVDQHRLDDHITEGTLALRQDSIPLAIMGKGVRYTLSAEVSNDMRALQIFYIKNMKPGRVDPASIYAQKSIRPGSVFSIEKNYDENYIFVPLRFAQELFETGTRRSALEVQTNKRDIKAVQADLKTKLGNTFSVLTNEEQHKDLYRLLKIEKLFTFLSLSLLVLVGSINIFFSLMMLAIDKKKDISILTAMGASPSVIRRIFLTEGAMISFLGAGAGLLLGAILCLLQEHVGLVGMGMENAIVSDYPVKMKGTDFIMISTVVIAITWLISFRPSALAARSYSVEHL